jgi:hypothetical protein
VPARVKAPTVSGGKMQRVTLRVMLFVLVGFLANPGFAQPNPRNQASLSVPTLVRFGGTLTDSNGKALTSLVGVTFFLYADAQGGSPLWMETQNVQPDSQGHYTVILGSTTSQGLPASMFALGEARWLGVQVQGYDEQPRVLLLSVPYALKAGDAATIGGLPPSAFVLAPPQSANGNYISSTPSAGSSGSGLGPNIGGKGTGLTLSATRTPWVTVASL